MRAPRETEPYWQGWVAHAAAKWNCLKHQPFSREQSQCTCATSRVTVRHRQQTTLVSSAQFTGVFFEHFTCSVTYAEACQICGEARPSRAGVCDRLRQLLMSQYRLVRQRHHCSGTDEAASSAAMTSLGRCGPQRRTPENNFTACCCARLIAGCYNFEQSGQAGRMSKEQILNSDTHNWRHHNAQASPIFAVDERRCTLFNY